MLTILDSVVSIQEVRVIFIQHFRMFKFFIYKRLEFFKKIIKRKK